MSLPPTFAPSALQGCADIHCHILPGVDDGPESIEQSVGLCRVLAREGITTAVATPHMLGRYEGANLAPDVRKATADLQGALDRFRVKLKVVPGGEVRLDERVLRLIEQDKILTIADGKRYLLLELPNGLAFEPTSVLARVSVPGIRVILAHAERYEFLQNIDAARTWADAGAIIQVNTSSLVGGWSPAAQQAGWAMLEAGIVGVLASDAHSIGQRRPRWQEALVAVTQRLGEATARQLAIENPSRIIAGHDLA